MQAREKIVTTGDVNLATEARGTPANGTILLVMGATASMAWWPEALVERLAAGGFQVIRYDHRDTGRSTTNPPGAAAYDVDDLADDLFAVLDAYGVQQAHLVGLSLGGYLAQINALRQPDRVLSLTLIAAEPFGHAYEGEGMPEDFMAHFGTMESVDWSDNEAVAAFLLRIAELSSGDPAVFEVEAARARIATELSRSKSMKSAFNHAMMAGVIDLQKTAADIGQKVLLIHGADDPLISVNAARQAAEMISDAELVVLDGTGHELLSKDMPLVSERILAHCRSAGEWHGG